MIASIRMAGEPGRLALVESRGIEEYWKRTRKRNSGYDSGSMGGFESVPDRDAMAGREGHSETAAERRERQTHEIAAIVFDVVKRDFDHALFIAQRDLERPSGYDRLGHYEAYIHYVQGRTVALIDALARLTGADDEMKAAVVKIIGYEADFKGAPESLDAIGVTDWRDPLVDDEGGLDGGRRARS